MTTVNKLSTVIIDDELPIREFISQIVSEYSDDAEVVGTADSVNSGIQLIREKNPKLVIIDIQLLDGTAFDLLEKLVEPKFAVIFITAFENYAVKAFKISAVDYILKPIHIDELLAAIKKANQQIEYKNLSTKLQNLFSNMNSKPEDKKIVLKTQESIHIVKLGEIIRCEADQNYTTFILTSGKRIIVSRTIKEFDELFNEMGFFRSHQSHLINMNCINSFEKNDGGYLQMSDGSRVPVSKRKRDELLTRLNNF